MPFFFLLPLWMLVVVASIGMLFTRRYNSLALYLLFSSTGGLLLSFVASSAVLLIGPTLVAGTRFGWLVLLGYGTGIVFGGFLGILAGLFFAYRFTATSRKR